MHAISAAAMARSAAALGGGGTVDNIEGPGLRVREFFEQHTVVFRELSAWAWDLCFKGNSVVSV